MPLYEQDDDKEEKSHQHKGKTEHYAVRSSGNSAGASDNEDQNTKPQEIAFRDMSVKQQYIYILRYGSGFKWYEGQGEGETLNNPYVQDDNNIQPLKQQERAFNDMTTGQKLTWLLHLGNTVGDALSKPQRPTIELEASLRKHGSPTEKPPVPGGNPRASAPSLFLRPGAPPLAPGRMNALHHALLTKQSHGADPTPVKSGSVFFPGAAAAAVRHSHFPSNVADKQNEKAPEYSQLMKMTSRDYLSAMNTKHGTRIRVGKKIRIFDGRERSVYITTMLENKDNQIAKVFYEPYRDYPQSLIEDLETYRTRHTIPQQTVIPRQTVTPQVTPPVELGRADFIQLERTDFLNVMAAYDETRGNLTEINQRSQRHELADTADDSWTTIENTIKAIYEEWMFSSSSRNVAETLQLYDRMIDDLSNQLNALTHSGNHAEIRHLHNSITMLQVEKYKQQALSEDVGIILDYLGNHTVTVSDDPRIAINQALVLTYKIADPKMPARMLHKIDFTDKEIIEDAQKARTTHRQRDPEMASWLDERQLKIFYIITKRKEWTGGRALASLSIDEFYQHASTKNSAPLSEEQIFKHFEKSVASPAKDYLSVAALKGVSSFTSDKEFYNNINNYKRHDAENEADDVLHYLVDFAGLYPLDLDKPLKKVVFLNVNIPAFGLTYLGLPHFSYTGDRNRWVKAEGHLCLFQTDSDDYWIFSTIQNMLYLKKITQHDFMRFSHPLSQESQVRALFGKIPELRSILPKPETKTKGLIGTQERRYYQTEITRVDGITATTALGDVLARMATRAFQGLAEIKKEFRFTERFEKPADFDTWDLGTKTKWYLGNIRKTVGDFINALFKPLEMLSRYLDDDDYNPSDEDWAELIFDVVITLMTLGISAALAGVKVSKVFVVVIRSARAQGLKGAALKKFVFTALRLELRKAAGSVGRELVGEVFPVIDWASFITSVGKSNYNNIQKLVPSFKKNFADNNLSRKTFNLDDIIAPPSQSNSAIKNTLLKKPGYYRDSPIIAEGTAAKIYDTQDGYLVKEYKRELKDSPIKIPPETDSSAFVKASSFAGALSEANINRDAFNRIYGEGSASLHIIDGATPFVKIVYVKMKKIPGSSLSSILEKADNNEISMVEKILNNPDEFTSQSNAMLDTLKVNGIQHYDINLGNIIFDPNRQEFHFIDFDRASINSMVNGEIVPLTDSQIDTMRSKLNADLHEFQRIAKTTKRVPAAERIFGQDASFIEVIPSTGIYRLTAHGYFSNTGHYSGVQTANQIKSLLDKEKIAKLELESCFGGLGGKYSNAQIIANELNIPVKTYIGRVSEYSKQKNPDNYVVKKPMENNAQKAQAIVVNEKIFGLSERFLSIRRAFNSIRKHRSSRDAVNIQLENIVKKQDQNLSYDMWLTACFEEIMKMPELLAQLGLAELKGQMR